MNMQTTNFTYGNTLDLKLSPSMEEKLRKIKLYVKYVWMMWATRLAIPATCQPIFDENMVLSEVLQVSSGHGETDKAQRLTNLLSSFWDILLSMSAESKWHYVCEGSIIYQLP